MAKLSEKLYTLAGYSTHNNVRKIRVSNSDKRAAHLAGRCGGTDVVLAALPYPMTRAQVTEYFANGFVAAPVAALINVVPPVVVVDTNDAPQDTVKWLKEGEKAAADDGEVMYKTFEEALAAVPLRSDKGHFIAKHVREALARDMVEA